MQISSVQAETAAERASGLVTVLRVLPTALALSLALVGLYNVWRIAAYSYRVYTYREAMAGWRADWQANYSRRHTRRYRVEYARIILYGEERWEPVSPPPDTARDVIRVIRGPRHPFSWGWVGRAVTYLGAALLLGVYASRVAFRLAKLAELQWRFAAGAAVLGIMTGAGAALLAYGPLGLPYGATIVLGVTVVAAQTSVGFCTRPRLRQYGRTLQAYKESVAAVAQVAAEHGWERKSTRDLYGVFVRFCQNRNLASLPEGEFCVLVEDEIEKLTHAAYDKFLHEFCARQIEIVPDYQQYLAWSLATRSCHMGKRAYRESATHQSKLHAEQTVREFASDSSVRQANEITDYDRYCLWCTARGRYAFAPDDFRHVVDIVLHPTETLVTTCPQCHGRGEGEFTCRMCGGRGKIQSERRLQRTTRITGFLGEVTNEPVYGSDTITCPRCQGAGTAKRQRCPKCDGSGRISTTVVRTVSYGKVAPPEWLGP